jgi:hypothetical protein
MKIVMQVALEEGDDANFSVELADGTVLTPTNGVVHLDPAPFLKKKSGDAAAAKPANKRPSKKKPVAASTPAAGQQ